MSIEQRSEAGDCDPARGIAAPGDPFGGWEMVQSDWGSRQHDTGRSRVIAALRAGLAAAAGWLRRVGRALATTVGGGSGTPRSSAPPS
jgi:hypothetical protein